MLFKFNVVWRKVQGDFIAGNLNLLFDGVLSSLFLLAQKRAWNFSHLLLIFFHSLCDKVFLVLFFFSVWCYKKNVRRWSSVDKLKANKLKKHFQLIIDDEEQTSTAPWSIMIHFVRPQFNHFSYSKSHLSKFHWESDSSNFY